MVLLERAIRRNRRRGLALAAAAAVNAWGLTTLVLFAAGALFSSQYRPRPGPDLDLIAVWSVALGGLATLGVLALAMATRVRTLSLLGAVAIEPGELPRVEILLSQLAVATGTPPVSAALVADEAPNALAVGLRRRRTTIVVTTALVEKLTRDELEAVLAAQMCAVRRLDTAVRTLAVAATSFTGSVHRMVRSDLEPGRPWIERLDWSAWIVTVLTWPSMVCGRAVRRAILRSFDFGSDEMAVAITRHPDALASALRVLRDDPTVVDGLTYNTAPLWFEPIPHDETLRYMESGRFAFAATLDERLDRLEVVRHRT